MMYKVELQSDDDGKLFGTIRKCVEALDTEDALAKVRKSAGARMQKRGVAIAFLPHEQDDPAATEAEWLNQ